MSDCRSDSRSGQVIGERRASIALYYAARLASPRSDGTDPADRQLERWAPKNAVRRESSDKRTSLILTWRNRRSFTRDDRSFGRNRRSADRRPTGAACIDDSLQNLEGRVLVSTAPDQERQRASPFSQNAKSVRKRAFRPRAKRDPEDGQTTREHLARGGSASMSAAQQSSKPRRPPRPWANCCVVSSKGSERHRWRRHGPRRPSGDAMSSRFHARRQDENAMVRNVRRRDQGIRRLPRMMPTPAASSLQGYRVLEAAVVRALPDAKVSLATAAKHGKRCSTAASDNRKFRLIAG